MGTSPPPNHLDGIGEQYLPLQEAARKVGKHANSLHRYIRTGRLKRYRRTGDTRTYVDIRELTDLLALRQEDLPSR